MNQNKGNISEHRCLKCRRHYPITRFTQIDADEDVDVLNRLLEGELFSFVCPHCSEEYVEAYDLMVYSFNLQYQLYWFEDQIDQLRFINNLDETRRNPAGEDTLFSSIHKLESKGWKIRVLNHYFDLLEKIDIFSSGYHDGPIELMKVLMVYMTIDDDEDWTDLRFSSRINEDTHAIYGFVDNEVRFGIDFARERYDELWDEFAEECMQRQYLLNMPWAQDVLDRNWGDEE